MLNGACKTKRWLLVFLKNKNCGNFCVQSYCFFFRRRYYFEKRKGELMVELFSVFASSPNLEFIVACSPVEPVGGVSSVRAISFLLQISQCFRKGGHIVAKQHTFRLN